MYVLCNNHDNIKVSYKNNWYYTSVPESAKVNTHHCLERNNLIYIWYHAEGIEPNWEPPEVQQITNGELTYVGKIEHEVNVHIEVMYNTLILSSYKQKMFLKLCQHLLT